jgi:hypothetical protein
MTSKFAPNNFNNSIWVHDAGFTFGCNILRLGSNPLNSENSGFCHVGKGNYYDIEADKNGNSPLTGEKEKFTVAELEVYKVFY